MSQENVETIRRMYERWLQGDASLFEAFATADGATGGSANRLAIAIPSTARERAALIGSAALGLEE
jgi:hypothetical protein